MAIHILNNQREDLAHSLAQANLIQRPLFRERQLNISQNDFSLPADMSNVCLIHLKITIAL